VAALEVVALGEFCRPDEYPGRGGNGIAGARFRFLNPFFVGSKNRVNSPPVPVRRPQCPEFIELLLLGWNKHRGGERIDFVEVGKWLARRLLDE
jgi:hypothetical protein